MEQILIRNLPVGTKAALRARAQQRHRSLEAEARDVADIEFEPERLGLSARPVDL